MVIRCGEEKPFKTLNLFLFNKHNGTTKLRWRQCPSLKTAVSFNTLFELLQPYVFFLSQFLHIKHGHTSNLIDFYL